MVTISVSNDFLFDIEGTQTIVGQQPYKKDIKIDTLSNWKLTEHLNGLKEFTFEVKNDEAPKSNIFVERDISVPLLTPFHGIITEKNPDRDIIKFKAVENAWHLGRQKFKCCETPRIVYTNKEWYDKLWTMRREFIVRDKFLKNISDKFLNAPLLLKITDIELANHAKRDASDVVFTQKNTEGTIIKLKHKIERYTLSTGELFVWIEFPEISGGNLVFQMYFSNPDATDQSDDTTFNNFGFKGVWHLNESTGTVIDVSGNSNNGTVTGAIQAEGFVAECLSFDGIDDNINCGSDISMDNIFRGAFYERDTIIGLNDTDVSLPLGQIIYNKISNLTPGDIINTVSFDFRAANNDFRVKLYDHVDGKPTNLLAETGSVTNPGVGINSINISKTEVPENGIIWVGVECNANKAMGGIDFTGGQNNGGNVFYQTHTFGTGPTTATPVALPNVSIWSKVNVTLSEGDGSSGGWISAVIKPKSDGEGNTGIIMSKGVWALKTIEEDGSKVKIHFIHTATGNDGRWETDKDIQLFQWTRVDVLYNKSSVDNDPRIFINGEEVNVTETTTPTLVLDDDSSFDLHIGNDLNGTQTFDGLIDEVRIHDNPIGNIDEFIKVDYLSKIDENFYVSKYVENYVEQADIIADHVLDSANKDMPVVSTKPIRDLVSVFKLNNNALDSYGSNHGTWVGNEIYSTDSIYSVDKSAYFDNTGYIVAANPDNFSRTKTQPFTTSFWFKKIDYETHNTNEIYVSKGLSISGTQGIYIYNVSNTNQKLWFRIRDSGGANYQVSTGIDVIDGKWHFITFKFTGNGNRNGMYSYVDGVFQQQGVAATINGTIENTAAFSIGAEGDGGITMSNTLIDDVRFYNRDLTDEEIKTLYEATQSDTIEIRKMKQWKLGDGHITEIPDLVALWKFDQSLLDAKGNRNLKLREGTEVYAEGYYDQALSFTGVDNFQTDDIPFDRTDPFTLSAFIYPTDYTSARMIMCNGRNTNPFTGIHWMLDTGGKQRMQFIGDWTTVPKQAVDVKSDTVVPLNEWSLVTVTYTGGSNGASFTFYINGVATGNETPTQDGLSSNTTVSTDLWTIGSRATGGVYFIGKIDDGRVYERALTALEIKRLYEATDSGIDRVRDDDIPTRTLSVNFEHKDHLDSLKKIAKSLGVDIFFDSKGYKVFIKTKGKTVKEKFDKMQVAEPSFSLENVANIVNIVGGDNEISGKQREKTFSSSNTLKYDYETTIANKQIATDDTVDLVGDGVLGSLKNLTPDLTITTTPDQFNKYDLNVGDTLNINELKQDLQGNFKIIKIETTEKTVKMSLSQEKNQSLQTSGKDLGSIISNLINAVQDLNITPEG